MISKYRLQLSPNGDWTEWRNFDNPPKEEYCSSIQISEEYAYHTPQNLKGAP